MILHYIPDNPKFIEIAASPFRSKRFFESDLHIGNVLTIPCCSQEGICETQYKKILYHFFAEIMIDTEGFVFTPDRSESPLQVS